jgi:hypothetical protein
MYKFMREEPGYCRVYYRNRNAVYCLQNDGGYGLSDVSFYRCTEDGEPTYPIDMPDESDFDQYISP